MRKSLRFLLISLAVAVPAAAQSYPKWTVYGGLAHALQKPNSGTYIGSEGGESFSFQPCAGDSAEILGAHLPNAPRSRRDFRGIDASMKYNVARTWGIRTDVSALYDKSRAVDTFGTGADAHTDTNVIMDRTILAVTGIEVGDNAATRWRPFAHAMVGLARQRSIDTQTSTGPFDFQLRDSVTSFAMQVGGGIDLPITH